MYANSTMGFQKIYLINDEKPISEDNFWAEYGQKWKTYLSKACIDRIKTQP